MDKQFRIMTEEQTTPQIGRNEPCPCGSGKKYKRCHGVDAAPKMTAPKPGAGGANAPMSNQMSEMMGGMDPNFMMQMSQALQRLPKGQMQRLQAIMQKAMSGKDVSQEASEFEKTLPLELQQMMSGFKMPEGMGLDSTSASAPSTGEMTPEEAKAIVAAAAQQGKISSAEADQLLSAPVPAPTLENKENSKIGKFFGFGKK